MPDAHIRIPDAALRILHQICLKGVALYPGKYPESEKFLQGIDPEGLLLSKYIVSRDPDPVTILEPAECPAS
jgi:hypothetical protein